MSLSRVNRVRRAYRKICKTLFDYSSSRAVWGEFIKEARESFEKNRDMTDEAEIEKKIEAAEQWIIDHKHPDPYRRKLKDCCATNL
mmetsp:Transcript_18889/g.26303  ORF Transcript_18889/g.26303 Transcript_18889/m.26303 type:complete len:86 (+) Transcript_18889:79-336(+)